MKKLLSRIIEPLIITVLLFGLYISIGSIRVLKHENNVLSNDLQHTQEQLYQYTEATIILGEEKAQLLDILENIKLENDVDFVQHSIYDADNAFLVVIASKTVEDIGFHYTIRDPFDPSDSAYVYSILDVEVGTMMVALKLDSGNFVLLEIEN